MVGTLMIFFYFGLAYILIFTNAVPAEKTMRVFFAIPLLLYGGYRIVLSYQKIRENFFEEDEE